MTPSPGDPEPRCPTCRKLTAWHGNPARPFCSATCKLVDLGGWLDGAYRVPGAPVSPAPREPEPSGDISSSRG